METQNATASAMLHDDHTTYSFDTELAGMTATSTTAVPAMSEEQQPLMSAQMPRRPTPPPSTNGNDMQAAPWLDTPLHVTDHGVESNLRDSHGQQELPPLPTHASPTVNELPVLLEQKPSDTMIFGDMYNDDSVSTRLQDSQTQLSLGPEVPSTPSHMESLTAAASPEHTTEEAFAMLKFNDSHCYVRSTNLVIGRDMNFLAKYQQQKKEEKKKRARALQARRALDIYAREPSQPSLMGDDDPSGESLEGRPEPSGPMSVFSVFSEQGGPVAYNNPYSDDENEDHNRTRRRERKNKSSSNTSIAPKSLMAFAEGENLQAENSYAADGTLNDPRQWAQLPVHPPIPADIKKISREHLLFHYDSNRERWLLDVIGNGAIFNGVSYGKDTTDLELDHNDEIFIATLGMRFMLPESVVNHDSDPESDDEDDAIRAAMNGSSMSPARRLSELFSADDSSDDDDEPLAQVRAAAKPPVPKLKLKFKKSVPKEDPGSEPETAGGKGKGKGKGKAVKSKDKVEKPEKPEKHDKVDKAEKKSEKKPTKVEAKTIPKDDSLTELPEGAKTADSTRKPSDAARESAPVAAAGPSTESTPAVIPHIIDPTSVLANLAPDQLPEKRKGPGRPPKNGLLSKRDESGVKRKTKEFERRGVPVPALEALIAMVRQEQKAKDAANKAQARGEPIPDMPMPSIESSEMAHDGERGRPQTPREPHTMESGSPGGTERKLSPRMPRPIPREASPIKPMSEFTEEELKKPNMTYIYIIDEVLQNVEGGKADLQAIYDKIMKRWPFYKYKVGSLGWQSSVRHNLLSCERFRDAGKSGKGKLWAINHDHPLDNKKRKPTPPPRPMQMPMQNGQMPMQNMGQNQFGQPHYNGQYQQPSNGQQPYGGKPGSGPYYSPYGQSGAYGQAHGMRQGSNGAYPANASQTPQAHAQGQQPAAPINPFQPVVDAIMHYRTAYLGAPTASDDPEYKTREEAFNRGTDYFSTLYHGNGDATVTDAEISSEEPFMTLKAIFERHKYLFAKKPAAATPASGEGSNTNPVGQPAKQGTSADGSVTVSVPPRPGGQVPAPTSDCGPAAASQQPAPMALPNSERAHDRQASAGVGRDQDVVMSTTADFSADTTAGGAKSVQAPTSIAAPAITNGTPASVAMSSSAIPTMGPPAVVSPAATTQKRQPLNEFAQAGNSPLVADGLASQPMSHSSVVHPPALPADSSLSGASALVTKPVPPSDIPAAQQPPAEQLSGTPNAEPAEQQSAEQPPKDPVAPPAIPSPTTASDQTPTAAIRPPSPSAGTKRSADTETAVEEVDPKRSRLI